MPYVDNLIARGLISPDAADGLFQRIAEAPRIPGQPWRPRGMEMGGGSAEGGTPPPGGRAAALAPGYGAWRTQIPGVVQGALVKSRSWKAGDWKARIREDVEQRATAKDLTPEQRQKLTDDYLERRKTFSFFNKE